MKTLLTAAVVAVVAGFALNASASTPATTTDAAKPVVAAPVAPAVPAAHAAPTTQPATVAAGTATPSTTAPATTPAKPTTTQAAPAQAESTFMGQVTNLNPTAKICKVKDSTGKEWTFNLGTVTAEGVKVGDMVEGKFDNKTNTLTSWRKAMK